MANRMEEIAKMFNVELREVFQIKDYKTYYRFTSSGLEESADRISWKGSTISIWCHIITGTVDIVKLPWLPNDGEYCYIADITRPEKYFPSMWEDGVTINEYRFEHGFVFRTKKEAIEYANKILTNIKKC